MYSNHETGSSHRTTRRRWLQGAAGAAAALGALPSVAAAAGRRARAAAGDSAAGPVVTNGRIKQSVCGWCFKPMPLETLARNCAAMGIKSIELVDPKDWPILKKYGLIVRPDQQPRPASASTTRRTTSRCIDKLKKQIDACAAAGFPTVITFSGLPQGHARRRGPGEHGRGPEEGDRLRRAEEDQPLPGGAQQPRGRGDEGPSRLHVRQGGMGRRGLQADRLAAHDLSSSTSTTCRSCRATSSPASSSSTSTSATTTWPACRAATRSTTPRSSTTRPILKAIVATGYQGYVGQEFIPTRDPHAVAPRGGEALRRVSRAARPS